MLPTSRSAAGDGGARRRLRPSSLVSSLIPLLGLAGFCAGFSGLACRPADEPPALAGARAAEQALDEPGWSSVAEHVRPLIASEMEANEIPAMAIALVADGRLVWAEGFGHADADGEVPATPETVFRVGSVSKLFTDIAVMQRVEQGRLDLDAPITAVLPALAPENPFGGGAQAAITLRQLMSHRAGLVREPPVGHYFDDTEPTLAATVESLGATRLVVAPGSRAKYSNAGIAAVGYALEQLEGEPFAEVLESSLLEPLGMRSSAFDAPPELVARRAHALMWGIDGREFPAPGFPLGMAPAGSLDSTVLDLARFLGALLAGGELEGARILERATLEQMWTPQLGGEEALERNGRAYGIGFALSDFENTLRIGHGGAIYGFATELAALPERRLGVVVAASRDLANPVTTAVADAALRAALEHRDGRSLSAPEPAPPLVGPIAERLAYRDAPLPTEPPPPPPERWRGLIGEYGWDHNVLFVLEHEGRLHVLIEWFFLDELEELGEDRFRFPDSGLYPLEELVFERDDSGRATRALLGGRPGVVFERRSIGPEDGDVFRIDPVRPVEELRAEALAATPPSGTGGSELRPSELVDVTALDPTIRLDVRYATTENFMGSVFYQAPRAFLQRPAAEALAAVHRELAARGYGLLVHDAYRPWFVTKMFWDATPENQKIFVADPANGSRHNRGCAVDLTLYRLRDDAPVEMVGGYDEFSERSYPDYPGGTSRQRYFRALLREAMERHGFTVYEYEWWHFDHELWREYPIGNQTFEEIEESTKERDAA
ncbi:MAG TPA: serine hydrolase [Thermoanaerobaculia bacterium]|nr:serine hydrolase [Thermoanaerobaculia bacterium]